MDFYTADLHLLHKNILKYSKRPFETIEEHDKTLISKWNKKVKPTDNVYMLGDLTMSKDGEVANNLLSQLNGIKYLIEGNHEYYLKDKTFDKTHYKWIKPYHEQTKNDTKIVLCHYPILEWNGYFGPSVHLYGHVHNTRPNYFDDILPANAINVGVDIHNFEPVTLDEIYEKINKRVQNNKKLSY